MDIAVKTKEELKKILNQTTDRTAFVISFEEDDNENDRSEQPRT